MRVRCFVVCTAGLALIFAGGAMPASAGGVGWTDPAGDATQFLLPQPAGVLPNEPALDITRVSLSSDDKVLAWSARLQQASATPAMSWGHHFRFEWTYEGEGFSFHVGEYSDAGLGTASMMRFHYAADPVGFWLPCEGCGFTLDESASTIALHVPIAALIDGTAAADDPDQCPGCREGKDPLPPLSKGAQLADLSVVASRHYVVTGFGCSCPARTRYSADVRLTPTADAAPAPRDTRFTL